jgi:hypothetical protein
VVVVVHPGLPAVEVWWWGDPLDAAVFAFSGAPAAGFDHAIFCGAGQGEVIDVGLAVVGPIVYGVVDLAVGPDHSRDRGHCLGDALKDRRDHHANYSDPRSTACSSSS